MRGAIDVTSQLPVSSLSRIFESQWRVFERGLVVVSLRG